MNGTMSLSVLSTLGRTRKTIVRRSLSRPDSMSVVKRAYVSPAFKSPGTASACAGGEPVPVEQKSLRKIRESLSSHAKNHSRRCFRESLKPEYESLAEIRIARAVSIGRAFHLTRKAEKRDETIDWLVRSSLAARVNF